MSNRPANFVPSLAGASHETAEAIRRVYEHVFTLRDTIVQTQAQASQSVSDISSIQSALLALQSTGPQPLNVTGLIGKLGQAQYADIPDSFTSLPTTLPYTTDGFLIYFNGGLWRYNGLLSPPAWQEVLGATFVDTHANHYNFASFPRYDPTKLSPGALFVESDREVLYVVKFDAGSGQNQWFYLAGIYIDVWANRPSGMGAGHLTTFDAGFLFYATDSQVLEYWNGTGWVYVAGVQYGSLGTMTGLSLTASEAGFLFFESDFGHLHKWGGAAWVWGPGEIGSNYFIFAPVVPTGGVWHACDGSAVTHVNADGTTSSTTTPNWNGAEAIVYGGAAYSPTINPATAETWAAGAKTDAAAPGGNTGNDSASQTVQIGVGATVPAEPHTHPETATTHQHGLSNANATLNPPTIANGGLPAYVQIPMWFRR